MRPMLFSIQGTPSWFKLSCSFKNLALRNTWESSITEGIFAQKVVYELVDMTHLHLALGIVVSYLSEVV